jgi:hypothetical protein
LIEKIKESDEFKTSYAERLYDEVGYLLELYDPVFPVLSSGLMDDLARLRHAEDLKTLKDYADAIHDKIYNLCVESRAINLTVYDFETRTKKLFLEALKPYYDEFVENYVKKGDEEW